MDDNLTDLIQQPKCFLNLNPNFVAIELSTVGPLANKCRLTHWGRVTHICVSKLTIIGSDNGLSPCRRQAIIWTNAGILLIEPLGTNFNEILIKIHTFSFKKMHLKLLSGKCRPSCLGLNVLMYMFFSVSMHAHMGVDEWQDSDDIKMSQTGKSTSVIAGACYIPVRTVRSTRMFTVNCALVIAIFPPYYNIVAWSRMISDLLLPVTIPREYPLIRMKCNSG